MLRFLMGLGTGAIGMVAFGPRFQLLGLNINVPCEKVFQTMAERTYISQQLGAVMVITAGVVFVAFAIAWSKRGG